MKLKQQLLILIYENYSFNIQQFCSLCDTRNLDKSFCFHFNIYFLSRKCFKPRYKSLPTFPFSTFHFDNLVMALEATPSLDAYNSTISFDLARISVAFADAFNYLTQLTFTHVSGGSRLFGFTDSLKHS